jgi:hypothetical protein
LLLAGSNAVPEDGTTLEQVALAAGVTAGVAPEVVGRLGPGADFPASRARPVGLFVLFRVARRGTGR